VKRKFISRISFKEACNALVWRLLRLFMFAMYFGFTVLDMVTLSALSEHTARTLLFYSTYILTQACRGYGYPWIYPWILRWHNTIALNLCKIPASYELLTNCTFF